MTKKFLQYGAGNIGRGFLGQLFNQAGYEVQFIDINKELIDTLNRDKQYPINIVSKNHSQEIWIQNVSCIDGRDLDAIADAIAQTDIMATAVGVNVLPLIVPALVAGFRRRIQNKNMAPLDIIICENLIDADKLLYRLVTDVLSPEETVIFQNKIGLVEASIGRMVPVMTDHMRQGNLLRVYVENYCELPVDRTAFKGEIPKIAHVYPFSPFDYYIKRKLFVHNMGHALTAYLGYLSNYEYIYEAIGNPYIKLIVERAMNEAALALAKHYSVPLCDIQKHISDLLLRVSNHALGDTVQRVGRDTQRKLSASDRFVGAIKLCEAEGISPVYISLGIAAGLFFECPHDHGTRTIRSMLAENNMDTVLKNICELSEKDYTYPYIQVYYSLLHNHVDLSALLACAEENHESILKIKNIV